MGSATGPSTRAALLERGLGGALLAAILVGGTWLALALDPAPHSDWRYYWVAAGELDLYRRGGLDLWLLWIPKAFGLTPVASALVLNLCSAVAIFGVAWVAGGGLRWPAVLSIAYLAMLVPYFGIVQLDLIAAAQIALALACWFRGGTTALVLACALLAMAVSTKPQYALTLWAMLIVMLPVLWMRSRDRVMPLLLVLAVGSFGGFAIDLGLRHAGGNSEAMRTTSAVTLYGGLLVSGTGVGCGAWSPEAANAARADLGRPLSTSIVERLRAKPLGHWLDVMRCKFPDIVVPYAYALYWLVESPNVRARLDAHPDRDRLQARYVRALDIERNVHSKLVVVILATVVAVAAFLAWRKEFALALVPVAWVLSFWGVHLVFEIQGRYFLGLLLLAPILSAYALRRGRESRPGSTLTVPVLQGATP